MAKESLLIRFLSTEVNGSEVWYVGESASMTCIVSLPTTPGTLHNYTLKWFRDSEDL